VIVGIGLLARPLVDRLVESVAATDQERNSWSGPDPAPLCRMLHQWLTEIGLWTVFRESFLWAASASRLSTTYR